MTQLEWPELGGEVRDVWDSNARFWAEFMGESGNLFHRYLVAPTAERLLSLQPAWRVMEVACGSGIFARWMATQGAQVVATDISAEFVKEARARTDDALMGRLTYSVVDATDEAALAALGAPASFDAVVSNMALMDMPAVAPLMRAAAALLKPGGCFVFTVMHPAFNGRDMVRFAEEDDQDGVYSARYGVKCYYYNTSMPALGIGIRNQPRPQYYFHRRISDLLAFGFAAGFVVDGMEEPVFPKEVADTLRPLTMAMMELPPVLGVRLRKPG